MSETFRVLPPLSPLHVRLYIYPPSQNSTEHITSLYLTLINISTTEKLLVLFQSCFEVQRFLGYLGLARDDKNVCGYWYFITDRPICE
jgi:hypothetical protein